MRRALGPHPTHAAHTVSGHLSRSSALEDGVRTEYSNLVATVYRLMGLGATTDAGGNVSSLLGRLIYHIGYVGRRRDRGVTIAVSQDLLRHACPGGLSYALAVHHQRNLADANDPRNEQGDLLKLMEGLVRFEDEPRTPNEVRP